MTCIAKMVLVVMTEDYDLYCKRVLIVIIEEIIKSINIYKNSFTGDLPKTKYKISS